MSPKSKTPPGWLFPAIDRPTYTDELKFPENLPALSSRDLGLFHGRFVGLHAYASSELAKVSVDLLRLESEIAMSRHSHFLRLVARGEPRWKIDNVVESMISIQDLRRNQIVLQQKKETIFAYALNFERYASALSREMSRRSSEMRLAQ